MTITNIKTQTLENKNEKIKVIPTSLNDEKNRLKQRISSPSPKKKRSPQRKREKELKIRFTDEEFSSIKEKAGDKSVAEFMREYCLDAPNFHVEQQQRLAHKLPKIEPELFRILVNAGNNLNQIARHINQLTVANKPIDYPNILIELTKVSYYLQQIEARYSKKGGKNVSEVL